MECLRVHVGGGGGGGGGGVSEGLGGRRCRGRVCMWGVRD